MFEVFQITHHESLRREIQRIVGQITKAKGVSLKTAVFQGKIVASNQVDLTVRLILLGTSWHLSVFFVLNMGQNDDKIGHQNWPF